MSGSPSNAAPGINAEGYATAQIDQEKKKETRHGQAKEDLGGTQESPEEHTAMGNGSRGATTTATPKTSSGEDLTLKAKADSMAQMQQQMSAVQISAEPTAPRDNLVRSQRASPGATHADGAKVELPGSNDPTTTAGPKHSSNIQVPEGSRARRYSSRLTRGPLSDGILLDGIPASQWQPPPETRGRLFGPLPTIKSTVEGQIAPHAAATPDTGILGGALPGFAPSQPTSQSSTSARPGSLTADEQNSAVLASERDQRYCEAHLATRKTAKNPVVLHK
ncbi:unnamed protein product [Clonostachys rhizophaga]|uniref:Uncharacterized protein n=1 Tax=Clonostachys rhizophaga TaxID=160324 RepID=A0A9N9YRW7_9HYPO|nr:unnamed protein product [Clonostachys rhizophaga]